MRLGHFGYPGTPPVQTSLMLPTPLTTRHTQTTTARSMSPLPPETASPRSGAGWGPSRSTTSFLHRCHKVSWNMGNCNPNPSRKQPLVSTGNYSSSGTNSIRYVWLFRSMRIFQVQEGSVAEEQAQGVHPDLVL